HAVHARRTHRGGAAGVQKRAAAAAAGVRMRIGDGLSMSASALLSNPARTLLTILGITIGIACVVSMAAIGAGARARVAAQIRAFGANVILVKPGETNREGVRTAA